MTGSDIDSLHILPLADLPIDTKVLRNARLVKNVRLEGMLEMFQERGSGSGQSSPKNLHDFFEIDSEKSRDFELINKLAALPSYDVYSLRVSLRDLGIDMSELTWLKLSDEKTAELSTFMGEFTRPLVRFVYGDKTSMPASLAELMSLFSDPDATVARENLMRLAEQLDVDLMRIPKFLEDYADVYMSLSFYRSCMEDIAPILANFLAGLHAIRSSSHFRDDRRLITDCKHVEQKLSLLYSDVSGVLGRFRSNTESMWESPTAEDYRRMEDMILGLQAHIGKVLCALTVKMLAWQKMFPREADETQLSAKAAFVVSEMKYGLQNLRPLSETLDLEAEGDAAPEDGNAPDDDSATEETEAAEANDPAVAAA